MKRFDMRILWGGLLIAAGGLFLLQEFGLIPSAWGVIWGLAFGVAGCVFLYAFLTDRTQWWTLIPGFALLSLGALILVEDFFLHADWAGAPNMFLVLTDQPGQGAWPIAGASFILIYKKQGDIPKAQAMLTFFDWCYRHGGQMAEKLHYVPMPMKVVELIEKTWEKETGIKVSH